MPRIGVTGHVHLSGSSAGLVFAALTEALREYAGSDLHGVTCLAQGTDQIFARAVIALAGTFEVVLPAADYREVMVDRRDRAAFDELLGKAVSVWTMPYAQSTRKAYLAASEAMLNRSDLLFAVWDGQPTKELGDTAHVVASARNRRLPVTVLWPAGAGRL